MSEILKNFWNCKQKVWNFRTFWHCQIRKLATYKAFKDDNLLHITRLLKMIYESRVIFPSCSNIFFRRKIF